MESIRVKNLRSIVDSGEFKINKINILLGRNSSGKSSLLRIFPMFTESAKHELRGPLLWTDEDYDYGSFKKALHNNSENKAISFSFCWDLSRDKKRKDFFPYLKGSKELTLTLTIAEKGSSVILKELSLDAATVDLKIIADDSSDEAVVNCYINNEKINIKAYWQYETRGVLPNFMVQFPVSSLLRNILQVQEQYKDFAQGKNMNLLNFISVSELSVPAIQKEIESFLYDKLLLNKKSSKQIEKELFNFIITPLIRSLLSYCDQYLSYYFRHSFYIAPLRYTQRRYMIDNEFAIDQVDPTGKNLINFIGSLKQDELKYLNEFLANTLGINIEVEGSIHKELKIIYHDATTHNIVDVGYGYTQLLPIAINLWDVARTQTEIENTIIIEQPEVHLHPSMQSNLAHLILTTIEEAKRNDIDVRFIIETHSAYLVNRLGMYVYTTNRPIATKYPQHKISANQISIYLFNKENDITEIQSTSFDEKGRINKWPVGFMD